MTSQSYLAGGGAEVGIEYSSPGQHHLLTFIDKIHRAVSTSKYQHDRVEMLTDTGIRVKKYY